jgi:NADPH-dependent ferric siderophore reductase
MPVLSSLLSNAIGRLLFHPVTVVESEVLGGRFRLVRLQGEVLHGVHWTPGQAVQFFLGNLTKRAYTPMDVDVEAGSAAFLFHLHGGGPGSAWAAMLRVGDVCQAMRPKDSLDFKSIEGDAIFFGDDTSLAAAQALQGCGLRAQGRRYVLEVESKEAAREVVIRLALDGVDVIEKQKEDAQLDAVVAKMVEYATTLRSPQWVFTGQARSIQTVRTRLKAEGIALDGSKVRAYWSQGKTGMD